MHLVSFEQHAPVDPDPIERSTPQGTLGEASFEALEFSRPGIRRIGALIPPGPQAGDIVDLNRALAVKLALEDAGAPEAEADSLLPHDMLAFLRGGPNSLAAARSAFDWAVDGLGRYDGPDFRRAGVLIAGRAVRLCAPVPRPGKIVGVARNYLDHAAERGEPRAPVEPVLFFKAPSSVIGPGDEIRIPHMSGCVDYEGELAVVVGRRAHRVDAEAALEFVAGYTAANDVTARDLQDARGQHFLAKSCDTFAPMGPALVTCDEIGDPGSLALRTTLSGEARQEAQTKEMIFGVADIIAFASQLMTLDAGDVILTGTPSGVGADQRPPSWLREGDVVDVEIEKIGRLRNYVRASREGT